MESSQIGWKPERILRIHSSQNLAKIGSFGVMCVGAVVLDISTKDKNGRVFSTKQFCYVSSRVNKIFLSRQALGDLQILGQDFPLPTSPALSAAAAATPAEPDTETCNCPRRPTGPPPLPTSLPPGFTGTDAEVQQLKAWLLEYYGSTSFNVCEHQKLPKMTGPPLRLNMDPEATPVAVHKPASVPLHWRDKVKSDLDRDERLGVIE